MEKETLANSNETQENIIDDIEIGKHRKAVEVAKIMLAYNKEPIDKIMRYTNLSRQEIESLK